MTQEEHAAMHGGRQPDDGPRDDQASSLRRVRHVHAPDIDRTHGGRSGHGPGSHYGVAAANVKENRPRHEPRFAASGGTSNCPRRDCGEFA